ncbi:transcriptional regulator with XRE-family HTH domain [Kitasatospora sp. MAP12-15]|uniref:helix-turn-helix domain-containing protein n=1 Tax=unclassified Kitasatospora TaxID=2633591 RepID=UPI002476FFBE|nr:helix-turn-helix transcriptional regulator [Kitasatospora sp. MAP12-44]MDH6110278.1 transcriptional regulator with XRE-family HTH domain [Kitasatospora sp. MAP12-44]
MEHTEVDPTSSPRLRFGGELARLRRARGWSQVGLGKRMGYSNTLISYIERGKRPPTSHFAVKADEVFDTGGTLYELWQRCARAALLEGFPEFAEAEARCRRLRTYELGLIPGLFQTTAYATAMASAAVQRGSITQAQADERIAFLATRQRLLEQKSPPIIHAVMDQSCLVRPVGGRKVMLPQLDYLEELAHRPNVTIQVAPFSLAEHAPFALPVVLLTLPDRTVVGYAESHPKGHLERGREAVADWEKDYDQLQVESLSKVASLAVIRAVRKELE